MLQYRALKVTETQNGIPDTPQYLSVPVIFASNLKRLLMPSYVAFGPRHKGKCSTGMAIHDAFPNDAFEVTSIPLGDAACYLAWQLQQQKISSQHHLHILSGVWTVGYT